jgi:hypothetical protein
MSSVAKAMPINLTAEARAELKGLARSNEKRAPNAAAGADRAAGGGRDGDAGFQISPPVPCGLARERQGSTNCVL